MSPQLVPRDVKLAIALLQAEPARDWTIESLASSCGVAHRTLQKHFRRFIGRSPIEFLRDLRLDQVRRNLLSAPARANVTLAAGQCGFNHLGRFAMWYRERFGESPSATLQRNQRLDNGATSHQPFPASPDRLTIAILPLEIAGFDLRRATVIGEEIAAALCRLHWFTVTSAQNAHYHLRGVGRADDRGRLHVTISVLDAPTGRYLWADRWDDVLDDALDFVDQLSLRAARALQPTLRDVEIDRARRKDPTELDAWELTMRALPNVLSVDPTAASTALGWLERAMELAPLDPLPMSLAAWCHGQRAAHHFTGELKNERGAARALAARATALNGGDPLAETMLAAGFALAHDLDSAEVHSDRALALDGGSAWAWGRSAHIHAYRGEPAEAIERFRIAQMLAPADPLNFLCSIGIASAHFEAARYQDAARCYRRGLAEQPKAIWVNRLLAPSYALAGRKDEAKRSFAELAHAFRT